jgi:hypothetical protein
MMTILFIVNFKKDYSGLLSLSTKAEGFIYQPEFRTNVNTGDCRLSLSWQRLLAQAKFCAAHLSFLK